jgi:membrane associated rhomboid family serine protease
MKGRRVDMIVVVCIWVAVLTGAVLLAAFAADDDPATDDAAGAGALAGVVGGLLTAIYLGVRHLHRPRPLRRLRAASPEDRIDVAGAIALWIVGMLAGLALGIGSNSFFVGGLLAVGFVLLRRRRRSRPPPPAG